MAINRRAHPKPLSCSMLITMANAYAREVTMGNEPKHHDEPAQEQSRRHEEEKPQTWKHPDDGTELSERDQEMPLKP